MKRKKVCFLIGILLMLLLTLTNTVYASSRISAYSIDEEEENFFDIAQYSSREGISTYAASGNNQNVEDDSNIIGALGTVYQGPWNVGRTNSTDVKAYIYYKETTGVYTLYLTGSGDTQNSAIKDMSNFPDVTSEDRKIKIQNVVVGGGIWRLGNSLFSGLMDLKSVSLPESLHVIGNYTFLSCGKLEQITLPSELDTIGIRAFGDCTVLETVTINHDSKLVDKDNSGTWQVWIGTDAFINCSGLKNVYIYCDKSKDRSAHSTLANYFNNNYNTGKTITITVRHSEKLETSRILEDATCTKSGAKWLKCTNCNKEVGNKVTIPALGHDLEPIIDIKAGCVTTGTKHSYCKRENCSYVGEYETIPTLGGHKYVTTKITGTCDNPGTITKTCSECGDVEETTGTVTEHVWKETSRVEADCKTGTDGKVYYTCSKCGDTDEKTIVASHKHGGAVVAQEATCTEPGYWRLSLHGV